MTTESATLEAPGAPAPTAAAGPTKRPRGRPRAGVRRVLEAEAPPDRPPARPARARPEPEDEGGGELVEGLVFAGELLTAGLTVLVGRLLRAHPDDIAAVARADEDGRKRLQAAAGPLARYIHRRWGAASEHAPVYAAAAAVVGGVCLRALALQGLKRDRSNAASSEPATTHGTQPATSGASSSASSPPPAAPAAAGS